MKNAIHSQLTNFLNKKKKKNIPSRISFIFNQLSRKRKGRDKLLIIIIRRSGQNLELLEDAVARDK